MDSQRKIYHYFTFDFRSSLRFLIHYVRSSSICENYQIVNELFNKGPFLVHGPRAVFLGVPFRDDCLVVVLLTFLSVVLSCIIVVQIFIFSIVNFVTLSLYQAFILEKRLFLFLFLFPASTIRPFSIEQEEGGVMFHLYTGPVDLLSVNKFFR